MSGHLLRQAIVRSYLVFLLSLVLDIIAQTYPNWPAQIGSVFFQAASPVFSTYISYPGITVALSVERMDSNGLVFEVEAFRLEFTFPGLPQMHPPFVIYCPRLILAPDYVRRTLEEPLKEELMAWIMQRPRADSLMEEHVKNLQRKMRLLLSSLPVDAFILHLPTNDVVGPTIRDRYGSSQVSIVNTRRIRIVVTTNDDYSISYDCSRGRVPSAATVKAALLRPYLAAV